MTVTRTTPSLDALSIASTIPRRASITSTILRLTNEERCMDITDSALNLLKLAHSQTHGLMVKDVHAGFGEHFEDTRPRQLQELVELCL